MKHDMFPTFSIPMLNYHYLMGIPPFYIPMKSPLDHLGTAGHRWAPRGTGQDARQLLRLAKLAALLSALQSSDRSELSMWDLMMDSMDPVWLLSWELENHSLIDTKESWIIM